MIDPLVNIMTGVEPEWPLLKTAEAGHARDKTDKNILNSMRPNQHHKWVNDLRLIAMIKAVWSWHMYKAVAGLARYNNNL